MYSSDTFHFMLLLYHWLLWEVFLFRFLPNHLKTLKNKNHDFSPSVCLHVYNLLSPEKLQVFCGFSIQQTLKILRNSQFIPYMHRRVFLQNKSYSKSCIVVLLKKLQWFSFFISFMIRIVLPCFMVKLMSLPPTYWPISKILISHIGLAVSPCKIIQKKKRGDRHFIPVTINVFIKQQKRAMYSCQVVLSYYYYLIV